MSKENSKQKVHVEIFAAGDGVNYPKKGHKVTIHYTAYLAHNGQKFDSVSCFSLFTEQKNSFDSFHSLSLTDNLDFFYVSNRK